MFAQLNVNVQPWQQSGARRWAELYLRGEGGGGINHQSVSTDDTRCGFECQYWWREDQYQTSDRVTSRFSTQTLLDAAVCSVLCVVCCVQCVVCSVQCAVCTSIYHQRLFCLLTLVRLKETVQQFEKYISFLFFER